MDIKVKKDFNDLLYKILKALPVYLAYKNKDNVYQVVSRKVDDLYAAKFSSIEGKSIDQVYSEEAKANVLSQDQQVYHQKKSISQIIDVETAEGLKTLKSRRIPVFDDKGDVEGIISFSQDIEEFVKLDKELKFLSKIQNELIRIIKLFHKISIENYADIIQESLQILGQTIQADRSYVFAYHFEENTMDNIYEWCAEGIEPEIDQLQNIPITDFLDGWVNNHRRNESVIISDVSSLDPSSNLYQVLSPQGIKSLVTMPIFINDRCYGFIGFDAVKDNQTWEDIPEIFKIVPEMYAALFYQHDLIKAFDQLNREKTQAENAQSKFLAKVTHEIKTPIGGITASLDLLKETNLDADQKEYADIMTYSIDILKSMVQNILQHSKIEANKLILKSTEIDLESEIIKLIKANKYMATAKNIGIYMHYDYHIPLTVTTDVEKLRQILNNLISNAVKYTNYGSVEVKVSLLNVHHPYTDIRFEVIDTGIGIEEDNQRELAKDYYQVADKLNKNPSGTGLGLSIASELIQFLKGKLKVSSKKNVGSNFSFDLTMYTPNMEERQQAEAKVLLIDMNQGKHSNIEDLLKSQFTSVQTCRANQCALLYNNTYDFVFVHTNQSAYYAEKIDDVAPLVKHFDLPSRKILLIDYMKDGISMASSDLFDTIKELPLSAEAVLSDLSTSDTNTGHQLMEGDKEEMFKSNKLSILIVDDNNINRIVMKKTIQSLNVNVTEAENGYEAIGLLKKVAFDIILMDILMPGLNGYQTTEHIRELGGANASIPIIAVSANEIESTRENALAYGMSGVLEKPLNKKDLENLLIDFFGEDYQYKQKKSHPKSMVFEVAAFEAFFTEADLRQEIIQTFLGERNADLERLEKAFQSKSLSKIYKAVHYLKGSFAYLKAQRLFEFSTEILDLCDQKRMNDVQSKYQLFLSEYERLHTLLSDYLNS